MVQYTNYSYYDTPDGEDYFKKLFFITSTVTFQSSCAIAVTDCLFISKPVGFAPMVDRFVRLFSRPLFAGFVFETTVYMATNLRKKDDGWNHVLGGLAMFGYASKHIGNPLITWGTCFPVCLAFYIFKDLKLKYGYHYFMDMYKVKEEVCHSAYSRYTYSWRRQTPRTWLRADEVVAEDSKN